MNSPNETAPSVNHLRLSGSWMRLALRSALPVSGVAVTASRRAATPSRYGCRREPRWSGSRPRSARARERRPLHAAARLRRLRGAPAALAATSPSWFWPAVVEDLGLEFSQPWEQRRRRLARDRVGDVVRRRAAEHRAELRPPLGATDARRGRPAVWLGEDGARARARRTRELSREVTRLAEALRRAGRRAGRPRRDLPADVGRRSRRVARVRARRRDPGADLLRLRRAGGRRAPAGRRGEGR